MVKQVTTSTVYDLTAGINRDNLILALLGRRVRNIHTLLQSHPSERRYPLHIRHRADASDIPVVNVHIASHMPSIVNGSQWLLWIGNDTNLKRIVPNGKKAYPSTQKHTCHDAFPYPFSEHTKSSASAA